MNTRTTKIDEKPKAEDKGSITTIHLLGNMFSTFMCLQSQLLCNNLCVQCVAVLNLQTICEQSTTQRKPVAKEKTPKHIHDAIATQDIPHNIGIQPKENTVTHTWTHKLSTASGNNTTNHLSMCTKFSNIIWDMQSERNAHNISTAKGNHSQMQVESTVIKLLNERMSTRKRMSGRMRMGSVMGGEGTVIQCRMREHNNYNPIENSTQSLRTYNTTNQLSFRTNLFTLF